MGIGQIIKNALRRTHRPLRRSAPPPPPTRRSERDIYFTRNFHVKAKAWGLTEDHARFVFYEGDTVKENMKVATVKGEEIGIYVFRDRDTNQPVITAIWKRRVRGTATPTSRR
jgi:hypothetical protein